MSLSNQRIMKKPPLSLWLLSFLLVACVTVNVYFPAPAVDAVAEKMVKEIWSGMDQEGKKTDSPPPIPNKTPADNTTPHSQWTPASVLTAWLDWMVQPAYAEADMNVSTATIRQLQERLRGRAVDHLKPFLYQGTVGINQQGDMEIRNEEELPLKNRAELRRWVKADNQERAALYHEIAIANNHPEWEGEIRSRFALKWASEAQKGWWVQNSQGQWQKK